MFTWYKSLYNISKPKKTILTFLAIILPLSIGLNLYLYLYSGDMATTRIVKRSWKHDDRALDSEDTAGSQSYISAVTLQSNTLPSLTKVRPYPFHVTARHHPLHSPVTSQSNALQQVTTRPQTLSLLMRSAISHLTARPRILLSPAMDPQCAQSGDKNPYKNTTHMSALHRKSTFYSVNVRQSDHKNDFVHQETNTRLFMNPEKFEFVVNNRLVCKRMKPRLVVAVQMAVWERCQRDATRATWADRRTQSEQKTLVLFFLATSHNATLMEEIHRESQEFGDIIMDSFHDSLHNLTLKYVSMTKWVVKYCRDAQYMIHIDGDSYMNLPNVNRWIRNEVRRGRYNKETHLKTNSETHRNTHSKTQTNSKTHSETPRNSQSQTQTHSKPHSDTQNLHNAGNKQPPYEAFCHVWPDGKIIRDKTSKYFMPEDQIDSHHLYYPPYCTGCWYMTDIRTATAIYAATINSGYVWMPDVFIVGYIMKKIGGRFHKLNKDRRFAYTKQILPIPSLIFVCNLHPEQFYVVHRAMQRDVKKSHYELLFKGT